MQRETEIAGAELTIRYLSPEGYDQLRIEGSFGEVRFNRIHAPALIAFIQQWLDHDPEQELKSAIIKEAFTSKDSYDKTADRIIAAVREHDAKYRRET